MSEPIISVSGLRGIVGDSLTPEVAVRYACAFAAGLSDGSVVITRDGRANGPALADGLRSGLVRSGYTVIDAGVAATPTTGVLVRQLHAAGGVQISASHNPAEYNGLKLFSAEGRVIPQRDGEQVLARYRDVAWQPSASQQPGSVQTCDETVQLHAELILETVDVERIRAARFNVLLDANHGAGGHLGRTLLESLGCRLTIVGEQADGAFEHTPEPTAENLASVLAAVPRAGADVGFCQDPDADRLAVIDASGRYLGEEYTLAMCVDHCLRRAPGPIVTNCSTSRMSQDLAEKYGVAFHRTAVGEANVVDQMLATGAALGGEGNGGVIDPRVGMVRDSFVGMAMILDAMAARGLAVAQLADELPQFEIVKTKMNVARDKIPTALDAIARHFADAQIDRMDGVRLDWPGKWLLVRASNTEPIVRAVAEAGTADEAARLCRDAQSAIAGAR